MVSPHLSPWESSPNNKPNRNHNSDLIGSLGSQHPSVLAAKAMEAEAQDCIDEHGSRMLYDKVIS